MFISVEQLSHRFPGQPALFSDLNLRLEPNRIYALTGPSGSGKSTLLGLLAGWITPQAGQIHRQAIERIAWVFQNPHGVPRRSVQDHIAWPLIAQGLDHQSARQQAHYWLDRFGLSQLAHQQFRRLSGGEAQRLMLARGLASGPDLLLVDEPTAQLDIHTADQVNQVLSALANPQTIVVVATHDGRTRQACSHHLDLGRLT